MTDNAYKLICYGKTEKQFAEINKKELKVIIRKINTLKTDPRPATASKLINPADYYRLRAGAAGLYIR